MNSTKLNKRLAHLDSVYQNTYVWFKSRLPPRKLEPVLEFREQMRGLAGATNKMLTFALYDDRKLVHTQELVGKLNRW